MKKKYEQPEMNVENFKVEDAIMRARVVEPNPCEEDCTQDTSTAYNPDQGIGEVLGILSRA